MSGFMASGIGGMGQAEGWDVSREGRVRPEKLEVSAGQGWPVPLRAWPLPRRALTPALTRMLVPALTPVLVPALIWVLVPALMWVPSLR
jgi:hypothetical protein